MTRLMMCLLQHHVSSVMVEMCLIDVVPKLAYRPVRGMCMFAIAWLLDVRRTVGWRAVPVLGSVKSRLRCLW